MFRQFREIQKGEFFVVGGDCSQGGSDSNACQFYSVTNLDVPLLYHAKGTASQMTPKIYPVLNKLADITGIKPVIGLERNMGGASEMDRLDVLNRDLKYKCFKMPVIGKYAKKGERTTDLGFNTSSMTRPIIVGGLKDVIDVNGITIYDQQTIYELSIFIESPSGKPQAAQGGHDDLVISLAGARWMSLYERPEKLQQEIYTPKNTKKWSIR